MFPRNDKGTLGGQDAFLHGFRTMRPKQGLACDDRGQLRIRTDESVYMVVCMLCQYSEIACSARQMDKVLV